jgi:hypothetical protein
MSAEESKAIVRQGMEALVIRDGDLDSLDETYAQNYVGHAPPFPDIMGLEAAKGFALGYVPQALDTLDAEQRHRLYKMLRLRVVTMVNGSIQMKGVLCGDVGFLESAMARPCTTRACPAHPRARSSATGARIP